MTAYGRGRKRLAAKPRFPPDWNDQRVERVLAHYEAQSEKDAAPEDEAALRTLGVTVMLVPSDLLPAVRELIAKHRR